LVTVERSRVDVQVEELRESPLPTRPRVTLIQAMGKSDKMDRVVRLAAEIGVARIVPVLTERCVRRGGGRLARWRDIVEDATRVSGRAHRAMVEELQPLAGVLDQERAELAVVLSGDAPRGLGAALQDRQPCNVELLIGPEGGLTEQELSSARASGFGLTHLGPHTLRTEHAGVVAASIVIFSGGGLGGLPLAAESR
jgi:16S rRNA (uracil1498-N3)-methyltransferase